MPFEAQIKRANQAQRGLDVSCRETQSKGKRCYRFVSTLVVSGRSRKDQLNKAALKIVTKLCSQQDFYGRSLIHGLNDCFRIISFQKSRHIFMRNGCEGSNKQTTTPIYKHTQTRQSVSEREQTRRSVLFIWSQLKIGLSLNN